MATSRTAPQLHPGLLARLQEARARTDALFALLPPNSFYERPVAERHRLIFYLGHLEAFDWNLLSPALGLNSHDLEFDKLFAFGIDPVDGGLPTDLPEDWPSIVRVETYNWRVRTQLSDALQHPSARAANVREIADGTLLQVAIEHRLMHAETLAYLLHNLPVDKKLAKARPLLDPRPAPPTRFVKIPAGVATLGKSRNDSSDFGWDNEFGVERVEVPSFSIGVYPVTNGEYLKFVQAGGYQTAFYWTPEDWAWVESERIEHPHFWRPKSDGSPAQSHAQWELRTMFGSMPLPPSWPVYVTHAEASAFARWSGKKLPSEAHWHRAAYGAPDGTERPYPWGQASPSPRHGNFHHERWDPTAVDAFPAGASAFGVFDLMGNGWEWTSTPFAPLPGFEAFSFYPGYSANFFDGRHFVMKGGSPRTDVCMLRRTFRNWFQPHYPHVYATFRCVEE
jgi:iron(II)-dependent oxidoreductase